MSAAEIINELPNLTEVERQAVFDKLRELSHLQENLRTCDAGTHGQGAALALIEEESVAYQTVDLRTRSIDEAQASDLRTRLKTFAEDWNRPEAAIYDEDPPR